MKAKEWLIKFQQGLVNGIAEYMEETATLVYRRGGNPQAVEGAIREQRQKFEAICRLWNQTKTDSLEHLDRFIFDDALKECRPALFDMASKVETVRWGREQFKKIMEESRQQSRKIDAIPDPGLRWISRLANIAERSDRLKEIMDMIQES